MASSLTVVNKSDHPTSEVKRLTRIVLKKAKKSFVIPPLEKIMVQSFDGKTWESQYDGEKGIVVRLGRKVRYPNTWDRIAPVPTWEDVYVGLLFWCVLLHYQRACWNKLSSDQRKTTKKYHRVDCQELTVRFLKQWRVDDAWNFIKEKANAD
jgi:hypothetical protein